MKIIKFSRLAKDSQSEIRKAKSESRKSVTSRGHSVGCIVASGKDKAYGVTLARSRAIGSTCAERMALDQWNYKFPDQNPSRIYLIGNFNRDSWRTDYICTPCGACLEMFLEYMLSKQLKDLVFFCANWDLSMVLSVKLSELFPQFGKGNWPYRRRPVR